MKITVQATVSHAELLRALCQAVCDNLDLNAAEWCEHDAETLEAAARIVREAINAESSTNQAGEKPQNE